MTRAEKEAEALFRRWMEKTERQLLYEIDAKDVKETEALKAGLRHEVTELGGGRLRGEFFFLPRGRFVDMGAGRKRAISRFEGTRRGKKRKPKKWYSPTVYGRLNDLAGALGIEFSEQAVNAVKESLKE